MCNIATSNAKFIWLILQWISAGLELSPLTKPFGSQLTSVIRLFDCGAADLAHS